MKADNILDMVFFFHLRAVNWDNLVRSTFCAPIKELAFGKESKPQMKP